MRFGMGTRRAALDGLLRILDAGALEDLFTGPDGDAVFMYDLLGEAARGRASACYWEICRTARRRGVSPEYVIDRAAVLLASIDERRRIDAYRILGVEGMASAEAIRHRWLEFAKGGHPDVGGDPARFRRVKEAYELLRDPQRRAEYERYWLRALGPFERVVPRD
jgi:DnaJ-domain-containing protein 1